MNLIDVLGIRQLFAGDSQLKGFISETDEGDWVLAGLRFTIGTFVLGLVAKVISGVKSDITKAIRTAEYGLAHYAIVIGPSLQRALRQRFKDLQGMMNTPPISANPNFWNRVWNVFGPRRVQDALPRLKNLSRPFGYLAAASRGPTKYWHRMRARRVLCDAIKENADQWLQYRAVQGLGLIPGWGTRKTLIRLQDHDELTRRAKDLLKQILEDD